MRHDRYPQHGPRRRWWKPFTVICRCGLDAYPCYTMRMREAQRGMQPVKLDGDGPTWGGPTMPMPRIIAAADRDRPLLTPGQAARGMGWRRP